MQTGNKQQTRSLTIFLDDKTNFVKHNIQRLREHNNVMHGRSNLFKKVNNL